MNKQWTLSAISDELKQASIRKEDFLEQMNRLIPWSNWVINKLRYASQRIDGLA